MRGVSFVQLPARDCKVPPPSSINPNVSKELDGIVLKALSADRNQRYPNCDQFNRALIRFLYSNYPDFNASDLSYFAKELFKEEIKADRERFMEFGKIDIKPYLNKMRQGGGKISGGGTVAVGHNTLSGADLNRSKEEGQILQSVNRGGHQANIIDFGFDDKENKKLGLGTRKNGAASGRSRSVGNGIRLTVDNTRTSIAARSGGTRTGLRRRTNRTNDASAQASGGGLMKIVIFLFVAGGLFFGYQQWSKRNVARTVASQTTALETTASASTATQQKGQINLRNYENGKQRVFINGHKVEVSAIGQIEYPLSNKALTLRVEKDHRKHYVAQVTLNEASPTFNVTIPEMPEQAYGVLIDRRRCESGKITFDLFGEKRAELVPLVDPVALPAGSFSIYFQRYNSNALKQINLSIREDDVIELCDIVNK